MTKTGFHIDKKELKRLEKRMKDLPPKARDNVVAVAARFAMKPVEKTAKRMAPHGTGQLKKGIGTKRKTYRRSGTIWVGVGSTSSKASHLNILVSGARPHKIRSRKRDLALRVGGRTLILESVDHPGFKPNRFLQTALTSNESSIRSRFQTKAEKQITKEVSKLSRG